MILLILGISVVLLIIGVVLYKRFSRCSDVLYIINHIIGIVLAVASIFTMLLFCFFVSESGVSEKIKLYQNENEEIENTIYTMVKEYMEYEKKTYKEFDKEQAMSYVSLYPDLKSNELVAKQIEVYTNNKTTLNLLKEKQIDQEILKWWLYFG